MSKEKQAATTKKSFILYNDLQPMLDKLTIPQAGHLLKAIFQYQNSLDVIDLDPVTDMAMTSIVSHFKRDEKKWESTRATRSESGRKGGLAKQANARGAKQNKQDVANLAVSVSDSVSESGSENENKDITTSPSQAPVEESKESSNQSQSEAKKTRSRSFVPPSPAEVAEYVRGRVLAGRPHVDSEAFVDHYISKGWMIGKNKMKDWQASVRTWERNSNTTGQAYNKPAQHIDLSEELS